MKRISVTTFLTLLGSSALGSSALAATPGDADSSTFVNYEPPQVERRGGFTMGAAFGAGLGNFSGYPLEVAKLNDPAYEASTGSGFSTSLSLWLGGTPRDWLSVAGGFRMDSALGDGNVGSVAAPFLRIEAFPLYWLGKSYRDLGLGFDGGAAFGGIAAQDDQSELLADGGSMGLITLRTFYQPFHFWKMASGPELSYTHGFSQSMKTHSVLLGWHFEFFGVKPKQKPAAEAESDVALMPAR